MASVAAVGDEQENGDRFAASARQGDREEPGTREGAGIWKGVLMSREVVNRRSRGERALIGKELDLGATSQGRSLNQIRSLLSRSTARGVAGGGRGAPLEMRVFLSSS